MHSANTCTLTHNTYFGGMFGLMMWLLHPNASEWTLTGGREVEGGGVRRGGADDTNGDSASNVK